MNDKNPHTEVFPFAQTVFWKDNGACGRDDKPTRATLTPNDQGWPRLDFELPRQRHELEKVRNLMQKAYEKGRSDNRKELGFLLKEFISF